MVGYATVGKTVFGSHTEKLQMTGESPSPQDILANLDWSDGRPVRFGEVFLRDAASIEAVFNDPNSGRVMVKAEIPVGNLMLLGPRYGELLEARLLDASGNTLRRVTPQELTDG
jgi:hypothetical protein